MCRTIMIAYILLVVHSTWTEPPVLCFGVSNENENRIDQPASQPVSHPATGREFVVRFNDNEFFRDGIIHEPHGSWMRLIFIYELWIMHAIQICVYLFDKGRSVCQIAAATTTNTAKITTIEVDNSTFSFLFCFWWFCLVLFCGNFDKTQVIDLLSMDVIV